MPDPLLDGDPARIGPYTLHARLGGGGMGQVFLGRSPGGHTVAVKVVRPDLAQDVDFRRRFAAEVAAVRKVGGFYTAPVVDADPDAAPPWLATAYIPGPTLHRAVTEHGPLPAGSVAVLGAGLAEGLAAVHAQGVVHRDLKPGNVLLAADGPRLIDFGIARALDTTSHTHSSTVLGTAAFMSPEQARAEKVGPASDVFSLGCVLAFAATGRSPFGQGPIHAVIFRVVHEEPDLAGVPGPLAGLVGACLAKDPDARPQVEEVLAALVAAAPPRSRDNGSWLPEAVTEVLERHTLAYTQVHGPETGSQTNPPPPPDSGPTEPAGVELVIGNLSGHPMEVVVDDTVLGTVPRSTSGTFTVEPGKRLLLVRAQGRGVLRRITVAKDTTVRLAFDLSPEPNAAPVLVEEVVFTGNRLRREVRAFLKTGGICLFLGLLTIVFLVARETVHYNPYGSLPRVEAALLVAACSLAVGLLSALIASVTTPPALALSSEELISPYLPADRNAFTWDSFEQVSVVGEGRGTYVVVWPRKDLPMETNKKLKDHLGGKVVCRVGDLRAEPLQTERLRAALRWFAGDLWVEQPTAP